MALPLAAMTRRAKPRKRAVTFRPVRVPAMLATDLYASVYAPIVTAWLEAIPAIMDEYERTLATMTTDSPADVRTWIERTDGVVISLYAKLRDELARWSRRFEVLHRRKWTASVLAATGVDLSTMIGPEAARNPLSVVVERNVDLVRNVSDQARGRIADAVFRGFTKRSPAREVAAELREAVTMSRRRALLIASDQANKLAGALDQERRREVGIDCWFWQHSGKLHAREDHLSRDGNLYSDNPDRVGQSSDGKEILSEPSDLPTQLPYCGCTSRACLIID